MPAEIRFGHHAGEKEDLRGIKQMSHPLKGNFFQSLTGRDNFHETTGRMIFRKAASASLLSRARIAGMPGHRRSVMSTSPDTGFSRDGASVYSRIRRLTVMDSPSCAATWSMISCAASGSALEETDSPEKNPGNSGWRRSLLNRSIDFLKVDWCGRGG